MSLKAYGYSFGHSCGKKPSAKWKLQKEVIKRKARRGESKVMKRTTRRGKNQYNARFAQRRQQMTWT